MEAAVACGSIATAAVAIAGTCAYASQWPTSTLFGATRIAGRDAAQLALTFDDGPNGDTTLRLLDILAERHVPATFFLIAKYARQQPEIVRRIATAGHVAGNHTETHPHLAFSSARETRRQLAVCSATLEDILGAPVRYMRPPFGSRRPGTLRIARELGLEPVLWNAAGRDWAVRDGGEIARRIRRDIARNQRRGTGSNILLHDGSHTAMGADRAATLTAVEALLQQEPAARFVTVDGLR